ncbi:signal transducing adapter molecule 1 [Aethina tumida]|uniref:signal transducing adapter molecule 1 n=1 Tax=Aethina tumida TaxID=116153 RepID=UPI00096B2E58|nr:signal transducing adapter molecule 1 [Aethina tumida]
MYKSKPLFGTATDIAAEVENATSEKNVEEDWSVIISICDKAGKSSEAAKNYLKSIYKRLANSDPHIGVKAVTLLDACIKNSGKIFHIEVASREFETEITKVITKGHEIVSKKLRESLKRWAENEFKSDTQLVLIPTLYSKLKSQGYEFYTEEPPKKQTPMSRDPNVVESQEEEEQILKAIELSLKESSGSPRTTSSSLYPSVNMSSASGTASSAPAQLKEMRKVRALYDFEAAEENELTFTSGEIICVIDDSDANWWKGSNQRGEGLFPANFVTSDLSMEPEQFLMDKAKKMVQFKDGVDSKSEPKEPDVVEINEGKIDRLLHLLHEADPTNPDTDTEEMLKLEREVNGMGPLIDAELERVDRKHAQLTQLSADLVEALNLYHTLMREPQFGPPVTKVPYGYPGNPNLPPPSSMPFNGYTQTMPMTQAQGAMAAAPPSMGHEQRGPPPPQQFMPPPHHMPGFPPHMMPGGPNPGQMPPGVQPPLPHMHPGSDERSRAVDPRFQNLPNFGHQNMPGPNFPPSQGPMAGPPQQNLPYIPSSTHIMQ